MPPRKKAPQKSALTAPSTTPSLPTESWLQVMREAYLACRNPFEAQRQRIIFAGVSRQWYKLAVNREVFVVRTVAQAERLAERWDWEKRKAGRGAKVVKELDIKLEGPMSGPKRGPSAFALVERCGPALEVLAFSIGGQHVNAKQMSLILELSQSLRSLVLSPSLSCSYTLPAKLPSSWPNLQHLDVGYLFRKLFPNLGSKLAALTSIRLESHAGRADLDAVRALASQLVYFGMGQWTQGSKIIKRFIPVIKSMKNLEHLSVPGWEKDATAPDADTFIEVVRALPRLKTLEVTHLKVSPSEIKEWIASFSGSTMRGLRFALAARKMWANADMTRLRKLAREHGMYLEGQFTVPIMTR